VAERAVQSCDAMRSSLMGRRPGVRRNDWVGGEFDPERFSVSDVNRELSSLK
jgi:hypothetical protein